MSRRSSTFAVRKAAATIPFPVERAFPIEPGIITAAVETKAKSLNEKKIPGRAGLKFLVVSQAVAPVPPLVQERAAG